MGFLSKIFGKKNVREREEEPAVISVLSEDERMLWAIEKAGYTLWYFESCLKENLPGQEYFCVKVRFEQDGHIEHLWLNEPDFDEEGNLYGVVGNEPVNINKIKIGQKIGVDRSMISDWLIVESGCLVGGYTIRTIRESIPQEEWETFDQKINMYIDAGADYFKVDFDTPEGAILSIQQAFNDHDLDKVISCKDFYIEAKLLLKDQQVNSDEELIVATADALEDSFIKMIHELGMPSFHEVKSAFIRREKLDDHHWIITEVCTYPDGGEGSQRLSTYKTSEGWKVLGVEGD